MVKPRFRPIVKVFLLEFIRSAAERKTGQRRGEKKYEELKNCDPFQVFKCDQAPDTQVVDSETKHAVTCQTKCDLC